MSVGAYVLGLIVEILRRPMLRNSQSVLGVCKGTFLAQLRVSLAEFKRIVRFVPCSGMWRIGPLISPSCWVPRSVNGMSLETFTPSV